MARWAASELKKRNMECVMVTLTFEGMPDRWGGKDCQVALNQFMTRFRRMYWCRDYLVARELQERGVYHYHLVVFGVSFLPFAEMNSMWGYGFVWLTAYDSPGSAMRYVLKEVDKGGRLHASIHLLDLLGVRLAVRAWRGLCAVAWSLHEALMCGRLDLEEYHEGYDRWVVGG
jgi:hypothetical protein